MQSCLNALDLLCFAHAKGKSINLAQKFSVFWDGLVCILAVTGSIRWARFVAYVLLSRRGHLDPCLAKLHSTISETWHCESYDHMHALAIYDTCRDLALRILIHRLKDWNSNVALIREDLVPVSTVSGVRGICDLTAVQALEQHAIKNTNPNSTGLSPSIDKISRLRLYNLRQRSGLQPPWKS